MTPPRTPIVTSRIDLLKSIGIFQSLHEEDLASLVSHLTASVAVTNEKIFSEGEPGDALFIIEEGAVEISRGEGRKRVELASLFGGQYFGELSLFDRAPRSATATASRETRLLSLQRQELVGFLSKDPAAALPIMAEMSRRLRQTNELMALQVARNVNEEEEDRLTLGQRVADRVAMFGGSWFFIFLFSGLMAVWVAINMVRLTGFDPYPFILLSLVLNSVGALQAPIIMMSQNRQSSKDKLLAENDYRVNLNSERQIEAILKIQAEILARLSQIEKNRTSSATPL
ncbi:MAG TPA: DUF1003 domain-containing protein [Thermoanaerobaculia bacterium]|nr:DUF1003 domain-containing protein [Thermoanaerobaculia bacterium]